MVLCSIGLCRMKYLRQLLKVYGAAILLQKAARCKGPLDRLLIAQAAALPAWSRN